MILPCPHISLSSNIYEFKEFQLWFGMKIIPAVWAFSHWKTKFYDHDFLSNFKGVPTEVTGLKYGVLFEWLKITVIDTGLKFIVFFEWIKITVIVCNYIQWCFPEATCTGQS